MPPKVFLLRPYITAVLLEMLNVVGLFFEEEQDRRVNNL